MNALKTQEISRWVFFCICMLAAIRVFIYSAAFPFFGNIDEQAHLDLVVRYSQANPPTAIEGIDRNTAFYIPRMESPEYFNLPSEQPGGVFKQPVWTKPQESLERYYREGQDYWSANLRNHEASQPPAYYWIAGEWMRIGTWLGFQEGILLYWVRFLNVLIAVLLVLISIKITALVFPENVFLNLGIPLMIALWPQDSFYAIQNDSLSPLFFGVSFYLLIRFVKSGYSAVSWGLLSGLMLGLTGLVKVTNYPLLLLAPGWMLFNRKLLLSGKIRTIIPSVLLLLGAFLPVAIWMNANLAIWGDLTGSAAKIRQLGWTALPVYEWFDHPLFSVSGFSEFLTGNLKTFWRGELIWWKSPIAMSLADWVFIITTLIFLPWGLISSGKTRDKMQVQVSLISGLGFILLLLLMGFLSIQFDYGVCENPSRAHPYFVSGRLISGAMIPFAILYLQGLYHAVRWIKSEQAGLWTIAALFFFYIASEAIIHIPVFESSYNFFHYITNRQF